MRAAAALERLRATVEASDFSKVRRITISLGFTATRASDTGAEAYGRADQALYVAKQSGRNQVRSTRLLAAAGVISACDRRAGRRVVLIARPHPVSASSRAPTMYCTSSSVFVRAVIFSASARGPMRDALSPKAAEPEPRRV